MIKKMILISVLVLGTGLHAKNCEKFDPTIKGLSVVSNDKKFLTAARTDIKKLHSIYKCINAESTKLAKQPPSSDKYSPVIEAAFELENDALGFKSALDSAADKLDEKLSVAPPKNTYADTSSKLTKISEDADNIAQEVKKIAQATYALAEGNKKFDIAGLKKIYAEKWAPLTSQGLQTGTLISKLKDGVDGKKEDKDLTKIIKGDYVDPEALQTYTGGPEIKLSSEASAPTTGGTGTTGTGTTGTGTTANNPNLNVNTGGQISEEEKKYYTAMADKIKKETDSAGTTTPTTVATTATPSSTTGAGSSGSSGLGGSLFGPGGFGGFSDKDKEEMKKRADERDAELRRRDMAKNLQGKSTLGHSSFSRQGYDYGRIKDIFSGKWADEDEDVSGKKGDKDTSKSGSSKFKELFKDEEGSADKGNGPKSDEDKYKGYFKEGATAGSTSSKDLLLNRFGSMYEQARIKALTEGAEAEYAGRYVDIFLLIHTVLDHQYRDKGNLMDNTEVVPSPLGGNV